MNNDLRKTQLEFSFLIQQLYGNKDYVSIKSSHDLQLIKKYYLKILQSIRLAIKETITVIDSGHKRNLFQTLDRFEKDIKSSDSFEEIDVMMVTFQSTLIFLLLGLLPERWRSKNVVNKKENWKLDFYRQIQFVQNVEQRKNLIFSAIQGKYKDRFIDWGDFVSNVYSKECNNKPEILEEWIKTNHPDIFTDLF